MIISPTQVEIIAAAHYHSAACPCPQMLHGFQVVEQNLCCYVLMLRLHQSLPKFVANKYLHPMGADWIIIITKVPMGFPHGFKSSPRTWVNMVVHQIDEFPSFQKSPLPIRSPHSIGGSHPEGVKYSLHP